jgi:hypothetical protein
MAEKKGTNSAGPSNGGASKPQAGVTKMEAVRQAIASLGWGAKREAIQTFVKEQFGVEMSLDHVSNYKSDLAKKAGKGKARSKKGPAKTKPAPVAAAVPRETAPEPPAATKPAAGGKSGGIPLGDILTVKELVERLGAAPLHTLIDAFAR